MGLTGGFADVGSLYDAMYAVHTGKVEDTSILDEYSRVRIQKWREIIDPMSRKNFGLIWDPALEKEREDFFQFTNKMESDRDLATQMANVSLKTSSIFCSCIDARPPVNAWTQRELRKFHQPSILGSTTQDWR
jgi:hypothetical protein